MYVCRKPQSNWQGLWCDSFWDLLIMWLPQNPPPPPLSLATGVHHHNPSQSTPSLLSSGAACKSLRDSPVCVDEPAGIEFLFPEMNCICFLLNRLWHYQQISLWLSYKRQTKMFVNELKVFPIKWVNFDFVKKISALPLLPKKRQHLCGYQHGQKYRVNNKIENNDS